MSMPAQSFSYSLEGSTSTEENDVLIRRRAAEEETYSGAMMTDRSSALIAAAVVARLLRQVDVERSTTGGTAVQRCEEVVLIALQEALGAAHAGRVAVKLQKAFAAVRRHELRDEACGLAAAACSVGAQAVLADGRLRRILDVVKGVAQL